jgi:hypothetical protein
MEPGVFAPAGFWGMGSPSPRGVEDISEILVMMLAPGVTTLDFLSCVI